MLRNQNARPHEGWSVFAQSTLHIYFLSLSPNLHKKSLISRIFKICSKVIYSNVCYEAFELFPQTVEGKLCHLLMEEEKIF